MSDPTSVRFRISLAANLLLLLAVGYLAAKRSAAPKTSPQPSLSAVDVTNTTSHPAQGDMRSGPEDSPRWNWRQLEAGGCRAYILRLRQIGCPERTIHDIMAGDVDRLYAARRSQLLLDGSGAGAWSLAEENRLIAHLFGEAPLVNGSTELGSLSTGQSAAQAEQSPSLPLVFGLADATPFNLDEGQLEGLEELRQQFIAEVGGLNQDPRDPAYGARWQNAQPHIDSLVPGLLGRGAFLQMQMEAANSAE